VIPRYARSGDTITGMQGNQGTEPIRPPVTASATRMASNHDWCRRGDNTKYKHKA